MSAQIIDGKEVAKSVRKSIKARIATLKEKGVTPGLATVCAGGGQGMAMAVELV